jgi:hypothetical protein
LSSDKGASVEARLHDYKDGKPAPVYIDPDADEDEPMADAGGGQAASGGGGGGGADAGGDVGAADDEEGDTDAEEEAPEEVGPFRFISSWFSFQHTRTPSSTQPIRASHFSAVLWKERFKRHCATRWDAPHQRPTW